MSIQQIALLKKVLVAYWLSVFVVAFLFTNSLFINASFGQIYLQFALLIVATHILETFVFHSTLKEHSNNILKDKCFMIPFGFLVPFGLKANAAKITEQASDSSSSEQ